MKTICVLGGSGFVGLHLISRLARPGLEIRVPSRRPVRHREVQIVPGAKLIEADIFDPAQLDRAVAGCDAVVNLVAILNQSGSGEFKRVHEELPELVVDACKNNNVSRLLHMSSLKSDPDKGSSEYARTKGRGEQIALAAEKLDVTSFRPSVIFGHNDKFFNLFATFLRLGPVFPLGSPNARFAPVWVGDVVEAMVRALDDRSTWGRAYELCGPKVYTLKELVEYTAQTIGLKRMVLPLGDTLSRIQAKTLELVPGKPLSYDNYLSMKTDNVCEHNGFADLGMTPRSVESIVPTYLAAHTARGRYDSFRHEARRS